jgi:hypothetical protein
MPFDPALPADHSKLRSDEMRAQLNALHDLITGLTARVTALENPSLISTGFGRAEMNGVLTVAGEANGKPRYVVNGYWNIWWSAVQNRWRALEEFDEPNGGTDYYLAVDSPAPVGQWEVGNQGHAPAGTVS